LFVTACLLPTQKENLGVVIYRLRLLWDRSRYATYAIGLMASFVAAMIIIATVFELLEIPGTSTHRDFRSSNWTEDSVGFLGVASFLQSRQCLFMSGQKLIPSLILEASVLVVYIVIISLIIVLMYLIDGLGYFQHFHLCHKYIRNPLSMLPGRVLSLQT